ncbi:MAG TPA: orotidine-5'-phosphate decarboxylase [Fibrobacteria bacterium]|nr:orotidine-5'-phosphate decarboxylase [Fibrobacteria bacterium]
MDSLSARVTARTRAAGNIVCFGLDPVPSRIPLEGPNEQVVEKFGMGFLDACQRRGTLPAAVKPNSAYFEALGTGALAALERICAAWREAGVLVVLDAKRGDIGRSSGAYARAAFGTFGADIVTAAPYMGRDSVEPFLTESDKGVYLLLRTSNPGARDFQDLVLGGEPLYLHVARTALSWKGAENLGFVVGATAPQELESIAGWFRSEGATASFLIPGVSVPGVPGGQGGGIGEVVARLRAAGSDPWGHLVNASSGLDYAWERDGNKSRWAEAGAEAMQELAESAGL